MSTEYTILRRNADCPSIAEDIELYEHSTLVDLCRDGDPVIRNLTGQELIRLGLECLRVAGYVHGDVFVRSEIEKFSAPHNVPWLKR